MKRIVAKLGGSQLTDAGFCQRLIDWILQTGEHEYFIVVGGGNAIDAMRELDRIHDLNESAMHWRCVWMLQATTDIVEELLTRLIPNKVLHRIKTSEEFCNAIRNRSKTSRITLVDCIAFYQKHLEWRSWTHGDINPPKEGWCTTTDALAIYCAGLLQADLCILLKSCSIANGISIENAAQQGIIDSESVSMATQFPNVQIIQL